MIGHHLKSANSSEGENRPFEGSAKKCPLHSKKSPFGTLYRPNRDIGPLGGHFRFPKLRV